MKKGYLFSLYILLSLLVNAQESANNLRLSHIDIDRGLSNSSVNCFYQDHLGFIWVGTENGLNKYDGLNFQIFRHDGNPNSISNNKVNCLIEDSRHNILIGTNQGLSLYQRASSTFKNLVLNVPVNVIFEDSQKNIWFGTDHGELHLFDPSTIKSSIFFNNEPNVHLSSNAIYAIAEDSKENLFIGRGGSGLNVFNLKYRKFTRYYKEGNGKSSISDNYIQSLYFDNSNNTLWIGTHKGLDRFNAKTLQYRNFTCNTQGQALRNLYSIAKNKENLLWIGTESNGAFVFNPLTSSFKSVQAQASNPNGLSNNQLRSVYCDKEGNIWLGCYRGGINLLTNSRSFNYYQHQAGNNQGLNSKVVLSAIEDRNKNIWMGTEGGGVNFLNCKTKQYSYYKTSNSNLSDNAVQCLFEDLEGKIWMGTGNGGLSIYNPKSNNFTHFKDPDSTLFRGSNDIRAIIGDHQGNIWIASNGNGISKFNLNGERIANYRTDWGRRDISLVTNWIRTLYIDRKNNLWIGSVTGISILDIEKNAFKNYFKDVKEDMTVYSFCEDNEGNMWVGTSTGLKKFLSASQSFETYTMTDGLADNIINGILVDGKNNLWLSTNYGLSSFNSQSKRTQNFDITDGLPDNNFIINAAYESAGGQMYFGSNNGLLSFNPNQITTSNYIAPISITALRIYNKPVKIGDMDSLLTRDIAETKEIVLNYDQAYFAFEFAAPNYANPKKNQYRYKLKGFDKDWIYNGSVNTAAYTNVAPGNYTFLVGSAMSNGQWTAEPASILVTILPPFWRSKIAYALYFLVVIAALYLSRRFIINKEKMKNDLELEKMKVEKAEEINSMKLNFFV